MDGTYPSTAATHLAPLNFDRARRLLAHPAVAESEARKILARSPDDADARLLLGSALRRQGKAAAGRPILEEVARAEPGSPYALLEFGLCLSQLGPAEDAREVLARAADIAPTSAETWIALGDVMSLARGEAENEANLAAALGRQAAEALRHRRFSEGERLLAQALAHAPAFEEARYRYAIAMLVQEKGRSAVPVIEELIAGNPEKRVFREMFASALYETGEFESAISQYEELLKNSCDRPGAWVSCGRALRAIGREEECVAAFRRALAILPVYSEAWRTLAAIKTIRLDAADVEALSGVLAMPGRLATSRAQLHFALGKAMEDCGEYAQSFEHYRQSQELQRAGIAYKPEFFTNLVRRIEDVFAPAFLRSHEGCGCPANDPIFVVGMPRAGSTLIQEILAAHPSVERTGELRDMSSLLAQLQKDLPEEAVPPFPDLVKRLPREALRQIGESYLALTRPRRKRGTPRFVDKYCENFLYTGLICLALPNAKIVDVRRHPLDCGLSCFRNYFPEGPLWSHRLEDIGRYYADYVGLMAHFDQVLPGRVHRLFYERLVAEPEREVRGLLGYLGLPFAPECLRFYEKKQEIVTLSIEQARQPIYAQGVGNSHDYEPWLGSLKAALGPVLELYPAVPKYYPRMQASMTLRLG